MRDALDRNEHSIADNVTLVRLAGEVKGTIERAAEHFTDHKVATRLEEEAARRKQAPESYDPSTALLKQKRERERQERRRRRRRDKRRARHKQQMLRLENGGGSREDGRGGGGGVAPVAAAVATTGAATATGRGRDKTLATVAGAEVEATDDESSFDSADSDGDDDTDGSEEPEDPYKGQFDVSAEFQAHLDDLSKAVEAVMLSSKVTIAKTKRVQQELERGWSERAGRDEALRDFLVREVLRPANDNLFRLAGVVEFYAAGHDDPESLQRELSLIHI